MFPSLLRRICDFLITAVREDRTPGGKHRHKRARVDDLTSEGVVEINTILVTGQGDELMTQKLVEARPDLIPNIEGTRSISIVLLVSLSQTNGFLDPADSFIDALLV